MLDPEIIEAKREYAQKVVSNAKSILIRANKIGSGGLVASVRYDINSQGKIRYIYDKTGKYVREGRRKGSRMPPPGPIEIWAKAKGIRGRDRRGRFMSNASLAFLIARSIAKKGIKPFDFLSMALRQTREEIKTIRKAVVKSLKRRIKEGFKK